MRTISDEQADALSEEFGFQVWIDFRPIDDGMKHWHARREDFAVTDIIHAYDADDMRRELIIWKRQHEPESVTQTP